MNTWEMKRALRDTNMRRALLELLQEATKKDGNQSLGFPEPMMDDNQVKEELQRILGIRKGLFR